MKDAAPTTGIRLELDDCSLRIGDVVAVGRGAREVECALSDESVEKIRASHRLKRELIERELPIYGVTTGFGDSADRQISSDRAAKLQQNMIRFLGNGAGQLSPVEVARATILLRANCLAKGNSGVRLELAER